MSEKFLNILFTFIVFLSSIVDFFEMSGISSFRDYPFFCLCFNLTGLFLRAIVKTSSTNFTGMNFKLFKYIFWKIS